LPPIREMGTPNCGSTCYRESPFAAAFACSSFSLRPPMLKLAPNGRSNHQKTLVGQFMRSNGSCRRFVGLGMQGRTTGPIHSSGWSMNV
jgi:hypothetical protein